MLKIALPQTTLKQVTSPFPNTHSFGHEAMATEFTVTLVHPDRTYAAQAAAEAFAELDRIEQHLSRFVEGSDVFRINRLRAGESAVVSVWTFECLHIALAVQHETNGAFDVAFRSACVSSIEQASSREPEKNERNAAHLKQSVTSIGINERCGFSPSPLIQSVEERFPPNKISPTKPMNLDSLPGAASSPSPPNLSVEERAGERRFLGSSCKPDELQGNPGTAAQQRRPTEARYSATSPPKLELLPDAMSIKALVSNLQVDLGAIGKGYALDRMALVLADWEINAGLLKASTSTILALDAPPGQKGWPISVGPDYDLRHFTAANRAFSGSGKSVKGEHIIDPHSGNPATRCRAWSAAPTAAEADALSTAFMNMATEDIQALCAQHLEVSAWVQTDKIHRLTDFGFSN